MKKIIREEDIDIVVAAHILAGNAAIRAAKKENIPVIFDLKDWFPDSAAEYYKNPYLKELIRRSVLILTKKNLDRSDCIITVSPSLVDRLNAINYTSRLITNGVDTEIFRPKDARKAKGELNIPSSTFVIGFVGAIERWFALDEVILSLPDILTRNPDTLLLIVGGGLFTGYLQELRDLIQKMGLTNHVQFTGLIDYAVLPDYIAAMDVCLIPFSKWGEFALPNKFFEYSACGKPIVMTPIPDVEKIGGPNLFVYHNNAEFLDHLDRLMNDPPSFSLDMERFSWKTKAYDFEKIFDRLTG
jgi:glycosyltransferase involved in cell wall biosynthesis